jgi:hypothetical protein
MVMQAIIRRYYCFPLNYFRSSSISFSNLRIFLVLLVMESGRICWASHPGNLVESKLSNSVLFVLCRLHQQQCRRDGASYRKTGTSSSE